MSTSFRAMQTADFEINLAMFELTKTNTQAKYQNGISYHLLLCFLAENETVRLISS